MVRFQISLQFSQRDEPSRIVAERCIEEILCARSWDLSAHYAGAKTVDVSNILSTVSSSVEKRGAGLSERQRQKLAWACYDLLQYPDEMESIVLAELGRVAFGIQLILELNKLINT